MGRSNMAWAKAAPAMAPPSCAPQRRPMRGAQAIAAKCHDHVDRWLKCAPRWGPAPQSAHTGRPPWRLCWRAGPRRCCCLDRRSAMMPEPITMASNSMVPKALRARHDARVFHARAISSRADFRLSGVSWQGQRQQLQHLVADGLTGQLECAAFAFVATFCIRWVCSPSAPLTGCPLPPKTDGIGFSSRAVTHGDHDRQGRRLGRGELVPALAAIGRGVDAGSVQAP